MSCFCARSEGSVKRFVRRDDLELISNMPCLILEVVHHVPYLQTHRSEGASSVGQAALLMKLHETAKTDLDGQPWWMCGRAPGFHTYAERDRMQEEESHLKHPRAYRPDLLKS